MSGFDIANWAVSIIYFAISFGAYILGAFFTKLSPFIGVFLGMFVAYTVVRVLVSRILGGALGAASDAVRGPRVVRNEHYWVSDREF